MKDYIPRLYDQVLKQRLLSKGAVLIEGPKWCGKTTTALQQSNSVIYMQDPTTRSQNIRLASIAPDVLLEGETPTLIDEWQIAPALWDAIRFEIDKRGNFGQFILTGSAVPVDLSEVYHSGTGRVSRMKMRTMSLYESGESNGGVSLSDLFDSKPLPVVKAEDSLVDLAFLTCRGGWPKALNQSDDIALRQAIDYVDAVATIDISRVDNTKRNSQIAYALLRSYSRMISSQGSYSSMREDLLQSGLTISEKTFLEYIEALQQIFVVDDIPAWNPNLRSKTAIRTTPTRHFVDPSIGTASLGIGPNDLINDLNTFGLLFEDLCVRDLRVYADVLDGEVCHYRDKTGLECDIVLRLRSGKYGLIEVKLGGDDLINDGAESLLDLSEKIDETKMNKPSFLMVLVGTGQFSYTRDDGIMVVPVRTLGV